MANINAFHTQQVAAAPQAAGITANDGVLPVNGEASFLTLLDQILTIASPAPTTGVKKPANSETKNALQDLLAQLGDATVQTQEQQDSTNPLAALLALIRTVPPEQGIKLTLKEIPLTPVISDTPSLTNPLTPLLGSDDALPAAPSAESDALIAGVLVDPQNGEIKQLITPRQLALAKTLKIEEALQTSTRREDILAALDKVAQLLPENASINAQTVAAALRSLREQESTKFLPPVASQKDHPSATPAGLQVSIATQTLNGESKEKAKPSVDLLLQEISSEDPGYKPVLTTALAATEQGTSGDISQDADQSSPTAPVGAQDDVFTLDGDSIVLRDQDPLAKNLQPVAVPTVRANEPTSQAARAHATAPVIALAAHLQQLAGNRDTRNLTLQLNPPELGRLQVKMSYGKDKLIKTDILVEKSDTYTMLQKDSDTLQQTLRDAGLVTDPGALNFSLADQGNFADQFADGSPRDISAPRAGEDIAVIEIKSSAEWSVDPTTGLTRYNIVV